MLFFFLIKIMNRFYLHLFIFFVLVSFLRAEIKLEDEDYLPLMIEMTEDYLPSGAEETLSEGQRIVVIRMENDQAMVVDVPRRGVFKIPADVTNASVEIDRTKGLSKRHDENFLLVPRMAMFLANRVVDAETKWEYPVRSHIVNLMQNWYLLYGHSDNAETAKAIQMASDFYFALPQAERKKTLFVYMDIEGNKSGIQSYYDTLKPSIQTMPGYLSKGYTKALSHVNGASAPLLVSVASSGRILSRHVGLEEIESFLSDKE